jgi:hypothetical protein
MPDDKTAIRMHNLYVFDLENYERVHPGYYTYKWGLYRPVIIGKYVGKVGDNYQFDLNGVKKILRPDQINGRLNFATKKNINDKNDYALVDDFEEDSKKIRNKNGDDHNYERPVNENRKQSFFGYGGKKSRRGYRSKKRNNKKRNNKTRNNKTRNNKK